MVDAISGIIVTGLLRQKMYICWFVMCHVPFIAKSARFFCSVQNVQDKRALYKGASSPQFCTWRAAVAANSRFCSLQGSYNISKMECTKSLLPWFSFRPGVYKACSAWKRIVFYCCKYSLANARLCLRFSYSTTIIFLETLASCTH